jgi:serine/threonine protein kinase
MQKPAQNSKLSKFGKYLLLDKIGEGGMAEIFRARLASLEGSGRFVVIKRIHSAQKKNAEFLQMFRAEVQVTMRLTHPNIVQLYEFGESSKQLYISMEYVEGKNVRQVLEKLEEQGTQFGIAETLYIIEQTAMGLHYAHTLKDRATGKSLNLVHRDVSPQNILVSFDGNVKVIDFGVAKASTNTEQTQSGVIKGKLRYLSPEQVMCEPLDGRSDVFALGIVFWELLANRRLFKGDSDSELAIMQAIQNCDQYIQPPSVFNPNVDPDLDKVVLQALKRDLQVRYQSCDEFAKAIRKYLASKFPEFSATDVAKFMETAYVEEIKQDRESLQLLNSTAEAMIRRGQIKTDPDDESTLIVKSESSQKSRSQIRQPHPQQIASGPPPMEKSRSGIKKSNWADAAADASRLTSQSSLLKQRKTVKSMSSPAALQQVAQKKKQQKMRVVRVALFLVVAGAGYFYRGVIIDSAHRLWNQPEVAVYKEKILELAGQATPKATPIEAPSPAAVPSDVTTAEQPVAEVAKAVEVGSISLRTRPAVAMVEIESLATDAAGNRQPASSFESPLQKLALPAGRYRIRVKNAMLDKVKSIEIEVRAGEHQELQDIEVQ